MVDCDVRHEPARLLTSAYQPGRFRFNRSFREKSGVLFGFIKAEIVTTLLANTLGRRKQPDRDLLNLAGFLAQ
jgi:hypothetical protein